MKRRTIANDTVDSFLNRNVGVYSDELEKAFINANDDILKYGIFLPAGITLTIPKLITPTAIKRRTPWD